MTTNSARAASLGDLIPEQDVYERFPVFVVGELKDARRSGEVAYYKMRKGFFYTEGDLLAYIEKRRKTPCENQHLSLEDEKARGSGNSKTSGSGPRRAPLSIIGTGTTEVDELAAKALERTT